MKNEYMVGAIMKRKILKALTIFFAVLTLISILIIVQTHRLPLEEEIITSTGDYKQVGIYDYVATLKPDNIIYDGKTTLKPNEGTIFSAITERIDISFTYKFECSLLANTTIRYKITEVLKFGRFQKILKETSLNISEFKQTTVAEIDRSNVSSIVVQSIEQTIAKISQEAGIYGSFNYNITIIPQISVKAITQNGTIEKQFTPALSVVFERGTPQGNVISIGELNQTESGPISSSIQVIKHDEVISQRYMSYGILSAAIVGLIAATTAFFKTGPVQREEPQKFIEEIMEPYEEIMIKTFKKPSFKESMITVNIENLEDLAKVADVLEKPILYTKNRNDTHVFTVIDGSTKYECIISAPSMSELKESEREEP